LEIVWTGLTRLEGSNPSLSVSTIGSMGTKQAESVVVQVRADVEDLEDLLLGPTIFEAARKRFGDRKYGGEVARMMANWHLRHAELAAVVCDSFLESRPAAGFVAVRPIFETAMTLIWIATSSDRAVDQYPQLLSLLDEDSVHLSLRLQSSKPSVRQRAKDDLDDLDDAGREFVAEAMSVGCRGLPGLRTRIEEAEKILHRLRDRRPSRLADAYSDYRVLSAYGHPTGFGDPFELDEDGNLLDKRPDIGKLVPMLILLREMPWLAWYLAEIAGWDRGTLTGRAMTETWFQASQMFLETHRGEFPDPLLRIWGWQGVVAGDNAEPGG
jgi:hypothetical protein